jgi:hypothetical protein
MGKLASVYDGQVVESGGFRFRINIERDDHSGPPWEDSDGHGPVSEWTTRGKAPGETVLSADGRSKRYYNVAEAIKIAKRDGWDAEPYNTGTKGERAARAVKRDFEYLKGWCNDEWWYVGVIVTLLPGDGSEFPTDTETDYSHALWGIESISDEYLAAEAQEHIDEILAEKAEEAAQAALEAGEVAYWEARDVPTGVAYAPERYA